MTSLDMNTNMTPPLTLGLFFFPPMKTSQSGLKKKGGGALCLIASKRR